MLSRDPNTYNPNSDATTSTPTTTPAVVQQFAAPAAVTQATGLSGLIGKFQRELGEGMLPADATTGCTVITGQIKFGQDMAQNAGDYLLVEPLNITKYEKLNLGIPNPSADEKKLQVNCYDGETVLFDDQQYTKAEFLALAKTRGFSKAKWQDRAVLHAYYVDCERHDKVSIGDDDKLMAIYMSPSSLKALQGFILKTQLKPAVDKPLLRLGKEDRSFNGTTWTQFTFERAPYPEDLAA